MAWKKRTWDGDVRPRAGFRVDLKGLSGARNLAAYAAVRITAPRARDAVLGIGSDDGVVVWFNGKKVHTNLVERGVSPGQDRVPVRLRAGENVLLLKVTQSWGGWGFGVLLEDPDGAPLRGLKFR